MFRPPWQPPSPRGLPSAVLKGVECVGVGRAPICRQRLRCAELTWVEDAHPTLCCPLRQKWEESSSALTKQAKEKKEKDMNVRLFHHDYFFSDG